MKHTVLIVLCTLMGACSPAGEMPADQVILNLQETYWRLLEVGGTPVHSEDKTREAHLILDSTDSRAHGSGGCNRFFAQYQSKGEALSFSAVGSTMMACPEGMETEQAFFSALGQTRRAQVTGSILELHGPEGVLARLEAVHPD